MACREAIVPLVDVSGHVGKLYYLWQMYQRIYGSYITFGSCIMAYRDAILPLVAVSWHVGKLWYLWQIYHGM